MPVSKFRIHRGSLTGLLEGFQQTLDEMRFPCVLTDRLGAFSAFKDNKVNEIRCSIN